MLLCPALSREETLNRSWVEDATAPQTANKDTDEGRVFFMLACVRHDVHKSICDMRWSVSLVPHKLYTNMWLDLYIKVLFFFSIILINLYLFF